MIPQLEKERFAKPPCELHGGAQRPGDAAPASRRQALRAPVRFARAVECCLFSGSSEPANVRHLGVWPLPSRLQLALARRSDHVRSAVDVTFGILLLAFGLRTCAQVLAARAAAPASRAHAAEAP